MVSLFITRLIIEVMDYDEKSCPDRDIALEELHLREARTVGIHLRAVVLIASQKRVIALVVRLLMCVHVMRKTTLQAGHGWIVQVPHLLSIPLVIDLGNP